MPRPFNPLEFNEEWLDRLSAADAYQPKEIEGIDSRLRKKILELTDEGHNFREFNSDPASQKAGEFLDRYTQEYFPAIEEAAKKAGRLSVDEEMEKFRRMTGLDTVPGIRPDQDRLKAHDIYSHLRPYEAGLAPDYRENVVIKTNALPPQGFRAHIKDLVGINRDHLNKSFSVPNNPVTPFNENLAIFNDSAVGGEVMHRHPEYIKRVAGDYLWNSMDTTGTAKALEDHIFNKLLIEEWNDGNAVPQNLQQSMNENYQTTSSFNAKPAALDKLKKQYEQLGELLTDKYIEPANKEIANINALIMGTPTQQEGDRFDMKTHDYRSLFNSMMKDIEDGQQLSHKVGLRQTAPSSYVGANIPGRAFLNAVPPAAAAALGPLGDVVDIATGTAAAQDKSKNPIQRATGVVNVGAGTSGLAAMAGGINPMIPVGLAATGATMEVLSDPEKRNPMLEFMRSRGPLIMPRY